MARSACPRVGVAVQLRKNAPFRVREAGTVTRKLGGGIVLVRWQGWRIRNGRMVRAPGRVDAVPCKYLRRARAHKRRK